MVGLETILGGLTGLFGSVVTSVTNYKTQKLKNDHDVVLAKIEIERMSKESEMMLAEIQANLQITQVQTEASIDLADAEVYKTGIQAASVKTLSDKVHEKLFSSGRAGVVAGVFIALMLGVVDFLRAVIRPGLTVYLVGLTSWLTVIAWRIIESHNSTISAAQAVLIFRDVSRIVIYLTVMAVTWWFGDRRTAKFLQDLKK